MSTYHLQEYDYMMKSLEYHYLNNRNSSNIVMTKWKCM